MLEARALYQSLSCEEGNLNTLQDIFPKCEQFELHVLEVVHPLHSAVKSGNLDIVKFLIQKGFNINLQNQAGQTPLFLACYNQHALIVKLLLKSGANPDIADYRGWTPLMAAVKNNSLAVTKLLIEEGKADPELYDKFGKRAIDKATTFEIIELLRSIDGEKLVLQLYSKRDNLVGRDNSIKDNPVLLVDESSGNRNEIDFQNRKRLSYEKSFLSNERNLIDERPITQNTDSQASNKNISEVRRHTFESIETESNIQNSKIRNNVAQSDSDRFISEEKFFFQDALDKEFNESRRQNQSEINNKLKGKAVNHLQDLGHYVGSRNFDKVVKTVDEKLAKYENTILDETNSSYSTKYKKFIKEIEKYVNLKLKILANKTFPDNVQDDLAEIVIRDEKVPGDSASPQKDKLIITLNKKIPDQNMKSQISPVENSKSSNSLSTEPHTNKFQNISSQNILNSLNNRSPISRFSISDSQPNNTLNSTLENRLAKFTQSIPSPLMSTFQNVNSKNFSATDEEKLLMLNNSRSYAATPGSTYDINTDLRQICKERAVRKSASLKYLTDKFMHGAVSKISSGSELHAHLSPKNYGSLSPPRKSYRKLFESPLARKQSVKEKDMTKFLVTQTDRFINAVNGVTEKAIEKYIDNKFNQMQAAIQREVHHVFSKNIISLREKIEEQMQSYFTQYLKMEKDKEEFRRKEQEKFRKLEKQYLKEIKEMPKNESRDSVEKENLSTGLQQANKNPTSNTKSPISTNRSPEHSIVSQAYRLEKEREKHRHHSPEEKFFMEKKEEYIKQRLKEQTQLRQSLSNVSSVINEKINNRNSNSISNVNNNDQNRGTVNSNSTLNITDRNIMANQIIPLDNISSKQKTDPNNEISKVSFNSQSNERHSPQVTGVNLNTEKSSSNDVLQTATFGPKASMFVIPEHQDSFLSNPIDNNRQNERLYSEQTRLEKVSTKPQENNFRRGSKNTRISKTEVSKDLEAQLKNQKYLNSLNSSRNAYPKTSSFDIRHDTETSDSLEYIKDNDLLAPEKIYVPEKKSQNGPLGNESQSRDFSRNVLNVNQEKRDRELEAEVEDERRRHLERINMALGNYARISHETY